MLLRPVVCVLVLLYASPVAKLSVQVATSMCKEARAAAQVLAGVCV
jgi:hypothetical protein